MNAIITGASRGIGKAVASIFGLHGYNLLLCSQGEQKLLATVEELQTQYPNITIDAKAMDLGNKQEAQLFAEWAANTADTIDVLVNNAGTFLPGTILDEADEYFTDKRLQLSIFMSPLNVHVNRNPVSGEVVYSKYHPGKFLVAWHPKSSTDNERHSVVYKSDDRELLTKQIAGALAKRIVNYLKPGMQVEQGAEMGFIKFGSRVDLFLPVDAEVCVALNQKVKGGVTVLAKW